MSNNKKKNKKVSNKDTENKKKRTASNSDVFSCDNLYR